MLSKRAMRRALMGAIGTSAMAGATLFGGASLAFADPRPPPPEPRRPGARLPTWRRPRAQSVRRWADICSAIRTSITSSPGFEGCRTRRFTATSRNTWTPTPGWSPKSTGSANPSRTCKIGAITNLMRVNSHGVTPDHHPRHRYASHAGEETSKMRYWKRSWTVTAATVLALTAVPGAIITIPAPGVAQRGRLRKRRPTGIGEWLREPRRRGCAVRSAAGVLRPHAIRPAAAPERHRMCGLQRSMGQRLRVPLALTLLPVLALIDPARGCCLGTRLDRDRCHRPLGHRRDRQARIHTGIGRDDRTVADEQVLVAEHSMLGVDNAPLGAVGGDRAAQDMCGDRHVEQRFGQPTLRGPTGPVGEPLGEVVGHRQESGRRVVRILAGGEPQPPAEYPPLGHQRQRRVGASA